MYALQVYHMRSTLFYQPTSRPRPDVRARANGHMTDAVLLAVLLLKFCDSYYNNQKMWVLHGHPEKKKTEQVCFWPCTCSVANPEITYVLVKAKISSSQRHLERKNRGSLSLAFAVCSRCSYGTGCCNCEAINPYYDFVCFPKGNGPQLPLSQIKPMMFETNYELMIIMIPKFTALCYLRTMFREI